MDSLDKFTKELSNRYPDLGISKIEVDEKSGKSSFYIRPNKSLPFLEKHGDAIKSRINSETGSVIRRRSIDRSVLDLVTPNPVSTEDPIELFRIADRYYKEENIVGSSTNLLASLSYKGFENDIDDDAIKEFFDVWGYDVGLREVLDQVFLDFFKIGHVTVYKTVETFSARESNVSPIPGVSMKGGSKKPSKNKKTSSKEYADMVLNEVLRKARNSGFSEKQLYAIEKAASKKLKYDNSIPTGYTILNPQLVRIEGSLLFDSYTIELEAPDDLKDLLEKAPGDQSKQEKELLKNLPNDFKKEIKDKGSHTLDPELVSQITYRKQPYERYAIPRSGKIFSSIEYKKALRKADLSTLDGISNYILKITIGNDEYPVTDQRELETVAKLFDTPSKSFDVVWNHTLKIEKIVSPEIDKILGQGKYEQVNDDISAGLAVARALLDGQGNISSSQLSILLKGVMEEINYARRQVSRWLYSEYAKIAHVAGFDRFPKIRWDDSVLKDTILYMNVIANLVDRRMLSYKTAHETLGFDYSTEFNNMSNELQHVQDGVLGIIGSPFQQSGNRQPVQGTPEGTPSQGRPKGQPAKPKEPDEPLDDDSAGGEGASLEIDKVVARMSDEEFDVFVDFIKDIRYKSR